MTKRSQERLYEGKAKIIYATDHADRYMVHFKDDATAFNGLKKDVIERKGELNLAISAILFRHLEQNGVPTHFLEVLGERAMLVRRLKMIPVEVVVRNLAAGSLAKRLGMEEGTPLKHTVVELYLKNDALGDPMVNHDHIRALDLADETTIDKMENLARKINDLLQDRFGRANIQLVDFKLEFGLDDQGTVILGDEISPDTCRLWDRQTQEKLDKDRFRRDLGGVENAYAEVLRRLQASHQARTATAGGEESK